MSEDGRWSLAYVATRAAAEPSGTVTVVFKTVALAAGAVGSKPRSSPVSFWLVIVDLTSPYAFAVTTPAYPPCTVTVPLPLAPEPPTSPAADSATGLTAIGLRTACPRRSVKVSEPKAHLPYAALVRVNATVNVTDLPAGTLIVAGVTLTMKPAGACVDATYTLALAETFLTVRVIVFVPGRAPTAIDG